MASAGVNGRHLAAGAGVWQQPKRKENNQWRHQASKKQSGVANSKKEKASRKWRNEATAKAYQQHEKPATVTSLYKAVRRISENKRNGWRTGVNILANHHRHKRRNNMAASIPARVKRWHKQMVASMAWFMAAGSANGGVNRWRQWMKEKRRRKGRKSGGDDMKINILCRAGEGVAPVVACGKVISVTCCSEDGYSWLCSAVTGRAVTEKMRLRLYVISADLAHPSRLCSSLLTNVRFRQLIRRHCISRGAKIVAEQLGGMNNVGCRAIGVVGIRRKIS